MTILKFTKKQALRVLDAALKRDQPIHIVKDSGIYIMVFGRENHEANVVEYAQGFDPSEGEDVYDRAVEAVGGDDFGEDMPGRDFYWKLVKTQAKWKEFRVKVTEKSLSMSVV